MSDPSPALVLAIAEVSGPTLAQILSVELESLAPIAIEMGIIGHSLSLLVFVGKIASIGDLPLLLVDELDQEAREEY